MLQLLILVGRALALGLRGHRELVLETLPIRNQDRLAAPMPKTMARMGFRRLAKAAIGTVSKMMAQASTVSMSSKRSNLSVSRT